MALSGSRLKTALAADILTQLQAAFPVNSALKPAEKTAYAAAQTALATAIANAAGPDVVTEVLNASISVTSVAGVTPGGGVSGAGTGGIS